MKKYMAVGLMSGTSLDGVDASLTYTDGEDIIEHKASISVGYPADFKDKLMSAATRDIPLGDILRLERELTEYHVQAVNKLLAKITEKPDVIGFHGQTIRHLPEEGLTWQLGDPNYLAQHTKIPVVSDFRRRDMVLGGQGAPLVPPFHQSLFEKQAKPCAIVNIGGVANITYLGEDEAVTAGDCGPGMGLLDRWVISHTDKTFDDGGELSLAGTVNEDIVKQALTLPFFSKPFPKSADRYDFDMIDVTGLSLQDGAATLTTITAEGILSGMPDKKATLWLTGGGSKNKALIKYLEAKGMKVKSIADIGMDPDMLEAQCFAWLAVRRLKNLPTTFPETTGCQFASCGGVLTT